MVLFLDCSRFSLPRPTDSRVVPPPNCPFPPLLPPRLYPRPNQESHRREYEQIDYHLILRAIPLKACRENIILLSLFAYRQVVAQAEFLGAVVAGASSNGIVRFVVGGVIAGRGSEEAV